ncbi:unnamed protein product [Ascophyllum nodosum]
MSKIANRIGNLFLDNAAKLYMRSMTRKLNAFGLKFDDLMMEENEDVAEAIRRLTPAQRLARRRRQLRAFDISLKKTPLPDHIQAVQEPFEPYLQNLIDQVKEERKEKELLNQR